MYDDKSIAYWDTTGAGGPHCVISGDGGSGRTMAIRTITEQLATRPVSTVFIGWRPAEHIGATDTVVCGTVTGCDPAGLLRAARALRAIADHQLSHRRRRGGLRRAVLRRSRPVVVVIDDAEQVLTSWAQYRSGHAISSQLTAADPLGALESLLALGRSAGVSVCLSVQRPTILTTGRLMTIGSVRDTFGTRCALGDTHDAATAQLLWDDHTIRTPRRVTRGDSGYGRAFVTHPDTGVAPATVWLSAPRADADERAAR